MQGLVLQQELSFFGAELEYFDFEGFDIVFFPFSLCSEFNLALAGPL